MSGIVQGAATTWDAGPIEPHNIKKTHLHTVGSFLPVYCILLRLTLVHLH